MDSWTYVGRTKRPLSKKLNPLWWIKNDDDPVPPDWYAHGPLMWWFRNPFHNLMFYVIGAADRNYTVYGRTPVRIGWRRDIGETGWHYNVILLGGWFPLPWLSYVGTRFGWYIGWQHGGKLGAKFNMFAKS